MKQPDRDNRTHEILEEIQKIQSLQYENWIAALARKIKVESLHAELDKMGYRGDRPPRTWNQRR